MTHCYPLVALYYKWTFTEFLNLSNLQDINLSIKNENISIWNQPFAQTAFLTPLMRAMPGILTIFHEQKSYNCSFNSLSWNNLALFNIALKHVHRLSNDTFTYVHFVLILHIPQFSSLQLWFPTSTNNKCVNSTMLPPDIGPVGGYRI